MIAVLVMGGILALTLSGGGYVILRMQENHRAQLSEVLDRLQAPEAAQMAALERVIGPPDAVPTPDLYDELIEPSEDIALQQLLQEGG